MFVSFFPRPKWFGWSVILWTALVMASWYAGGKSLGAYVGLPPDAPNTPPPVGVSMFWKPSFIWFDLYYWIAVGLFAAFWQTVAPHKWWIWSILGSALILFVTYLQVEVSVAINNWYGPFNDLIQAALTHARVVSATTFYEQLLVFAVIACVAIVVAVLTAFLASHYIFRWRTAMNDYYLSHWSELRVIEGASQRIQEDTMRFSQTTEDLGISLINSVMTLIAFLPVLVRLGATVKVLPAVGPVPYALVVAAVSWSLFGTALLALIGIKLPGLNFRNQRVEAAYRKELVYGEDDPDRAQLPVLRDLFSNVRRNYFKLYFNYTYFNVARYFYLQADSVFSLIVLIPSIAAGLLTLGLLTQIQNAFDQVRSSLQYLVNSWTTIVELQSIYRRLRSFESTIHGHALPSIDLEAVEPA